MHKYFVIAFFLLTFIGLFYLLKEDATKPAVKYFPLDENVTFHKAETDLNVLPKNHEIEWAIESTSSETAYLRQDISLLYENGKFKGVQSKWRQHLNHLELNERFYQPKNSLLQAISFHHGEIHYPDDQIYSIQKMTSNQLYFVMENGKIHAFRESSNPFERAWEKKLNRMTDERLTNHWNELIDHFDIDIEGYDSFPLTDLVKYENKNLPGRNEKETMKVIGQLWEGLYKNYIILLADENNVHASHYVPLILVAKNNDHLLVFFELNNKKQKLIQKLPSS